MAAARWYDPAAGRWLNQDPIGFAAGDANLYRYVGNQVTTKTDPSGLNPNQQGAIDADEFINIVKDIEQDWANMGPTITKDAPPSMAWEIQRLIDLQLKDTGRPGSAGSNHFYVFSCHYDR